MVRVFIGKPDIVIKVARGFPQYVHKNVGIIFRRGHDGLLPIYFHFIINQ
jgi:hypothetical protein